MSEGREREMGGKRVREGEGERKRRRKGGRQNQSKQTLGSGAPQCTC